MENEKIRERLEELLNKATDKQLRLLLLAALEVVK